MTENRTWRRKIIKTFVPTASGFLNFAFCSLIFAFPATRAQPKASPAFLYYLLLCALCSFLLCTSTPLCRRQAASPLVGALRVSWRESIMQNKPNFQNAENNATSYATEIYGNIPLRPTRKNKPKQTQFIAAKPMVKPDQNQPCQGVALTTLGPTLGTLVTLAHFRHFSAEYHIMKNPLIAGLFTASGGDILDKGCFRRTNKPQKCEKVFGIGVFWMSC